MQPLVVLICTTLWTVSGLKIGAFNIQILGQGKLKDGETLDVISQVARRYDVLLIQEIRSNVDDVMPKLLKAVNKPFGKEVFGFVVSARLGVTNSKEQYAFLYRIETVSINKHYQYPLSSKNTFERPPFSVLVSAKKEAIKSFFLLGIHVKPSNAFEEINSLHSAFIDVSKHYGTTRGIILGDFNAGCDYLSQKKYKELTLVQDPNFRWLLGPKTNTNVRKTCPYDKIVAHKSMIPSVSVNTAGVFRFDEEYGLTINKALAVSDHYPVEVVVKP